MLGCTQTHQQYVVGTGKVFVMWLKCTAARLLRQIHAMGRLVLRPGGPSQMGFLWVMEEQTLHTFPSQAPAGPARSTPSHLLGRVRLGRESRPLSASSRPCLVRTFSLLLTLSSTLEGTWQKAGRYQRTGLTRHRSERLQFWSVLISVNSSFVSHRSFKAQMLHLHCFEEISAAAI